MTLDLSMVTNPVDGVESERCCLWSWHSSLTFTFGWGPLLAAGPTVLSRPSEPYPSPKCRVPWPSVPSTQHKVYFESRSPNIDHDLSCGVHRIKRHLPGAGALAAICSTVYTYLLNRGLRNLYYLCRNYYLCCLNRFTD